MEQRQGEDLRGLREDPLRSPAAGYRCTFVESPPTWIQSVCPACRGVLREPYLTGCCGTSFCRGCIETVRGGQKACPSCQEPTFAAMHDKRLEKILSELEVFCENQQRGCNWKGGLGKLNDHLKECPFVTISCKYDGCLTYELRRDMPTHEANCGRRPFRCEHCCDYESTFDGSNEHWSTCIKYPVQCPNKCSQELSVERQRLQSHLDSDCPLARVDCKFSYAGCDSKPCRKEVDDHLNKDAVRHLSLLSEINEQLLEQNCKLSERITGLELESKVVEQEAQKAALLTRMVETLEAKMADLETRMVQRMQELEANMERERREMQSAQQRYLEEKLSEQRSKLETISAEQKVWYEAQTAELWTRVKSNMADEERTKLRVETMISEPMTRLDNKIDESKKELEKIAEECGSAAGKSGRAIISLVFKELKLTVPPFKVEYQHKFTKQMKSLLKDYMFYSHFGGFKLRLRLYVEDVNDKGDFFSKYSVLVHVMRGDFDDCLQWPFEGTLVLGVKTDTACEERTHRVNFHEAPVECKQRVREEDVENKGWGPAGNPIVCAKYPAPLTPEFTVYKVEFS